MKRFSMRVFIFLAVIVTTVLCDEISSAAEVALNSDVADDQQEDARMRLRFGTLCTGNSFNSRRSCDKFGCGHYGAPRKGGRHRGLDIVCSDGTLVYAPFSGTIVRRSRPYGNGNAIDDGIQIQSGGLCVKLFYLRPWRTSGRVSQGQAIGTMLPMQRVFRGITSHVHVQMCDRSDPSRYF